MTINVGHDTVYFGTYRSVSAASLVAEAVRSAKLSSGSIDAMETAMLRACRRIGELPLSRRG